MPTPKQTYIVTAQGFFTHVTVTVTQDSERQMGVGSGPDIDSAFSLAHDDYVKRISNEQSKRVHESLSN